MFYSRRACHHTKSRCDVWNVTCTLNACKKRTKWRTEPTIRSGSVQPTVRRQVPDPCSPLPTQLPTLIHRSYPQMWISRCCPAQHTVSDRIVRSRRLSTGCGYAVDISRRSADKLWISRFRYPQAAHRLSTVNPQAFRIGSDDPRACRAKGRDNLFCLMPR